jgi:hypothetical protein
MGVRNRVGIGLPNPGPPGCIGWQNRFLGIDFSYLAGMSPYISLKIKKRHYEHHMIEAHKLVLKETLPPTTSQNCALGNECENVERCEPFWCIYRSECIEPAEVEGLHMGWGEGCIEDILQMQLSILYS